jgi:hypothetical protein
MLQRLLGLFFSDYRRMVLATIGARRFLGKPASWVLRQHRRILASIFPPKIWSVDLFPNKNGVSPLSTCWLFGSTSSCDDAKFLVDRQKVLDRVSKAKAGLFEINGRLWNVGAPPCNGRWDIDPVSGLQWPQCSVFTTLNHMPGDLRFPWELGRLHHLVWFGQAWRYTRDRQWIIVGLQHIEKMLREAPFERGIHWRDGLQLAVRIYSLVAFANLCHEAASDDHNYINSVVAGHAYALQRQLSPHSEITNNHVIGEAAALALAGVYLQVEKYVQRGLSRLRTELDRQLYDDGIPYEGSLPYVRFDLDFLTLLALALNTHREGVPIWLKAAIALMSRGLAAVVDGDGRIPPIGDGDDARVLRLDDEPYLTLNESLHLAGKVVGQSFAPTDSTRSFALWTVGPNLPPSRQLQRTRHLHQSGLVHLNRGRLDVWLDCGPTGYGLNGPGGHGHNDTCAIVVHVDGDALLHDPGWYTYYGDLEMRDRLRSTTSHNTIAIFGQEQARLGGLFEIRDDCKPTPVKVREIGTTTLITCGHTGYSRLRNGIVYRRTVLVDGNGPWRIRVTDRVISEMPCEVSSHLGSDFLWEKLTCGSWVLPGGYSLRFRSGSQCAYSVVVPYSRQTGVLRTGSALQWRLSKSIASPRDELHCYISKWEMRVMDNA